jgi:hypothetical protein
MKMAKVFGTSRGLLLGLGLLALAGSCNASFLTPPWTNAEGRDVDLQDPAHALHETKATPWSNWISKFKPRPAKTIERKLKDSKEDEDEAEELALAWQEDDPDFETYSEARNAQRLALATLYFATDGDGSWIDNTDWLAYNVSECNWYSNLDPGDVCDDGLYVKLDLGGNNLTGTLPATLVDGLPDLQLIDLCDNAISGGIPPNVGSLAR